MPVDLARSQPVIPPARWQGEPGCVIGPFSSKDIAIYFATYVLNVGDSNVTSGQVFAKRDAWFVEAVSYVPSQTLES